MTTQNRITHTNADRISATDDRVTRPNVAKVSADTFALNMIPVLQALEKERVVSPSAIAQILNERGVPTARGGKWAVTTVTNLISRLAVLNLHTEVAL